jgi:hypothetical protein
MPKTLGDCERTFARRRDVRLTLDVVDARGVHRLDLRSSMADRPVSSLPLAPLQFREGASDTDEKDTERLEQSQAVR